MTFSELTSPLTNLTQKGASDPLQWMERLRGYNKPSVGSHSCILRTFLSLSSCRPMPRTVGWELMLSQEVEGVDRPILYISRKLAQREVNYSTVEKECLAIRWAVGALRYYLLGRSFTLWSDHALLQWLHHMKDANASQ